MFMCNNNSGALKRTKTYWIVIEILFEHYKDCIVGTEGEHGYCSSVIFHPSIYFDNGQHH